MLVYDILNNHIDCPDLLFEIRLHVPCRNTKNLDLFVIPKYNTFFSRALILANKISTESDLFVLIPKIFRFNSLELIYYLL